MKKNYFLLFIFYLLLIQQIGAQNYSDRPHVVNRSAPKEWDGLTYGGRFMDRYLPMPDLGGITSDTWGGENVKPREILNGIENKVYDYWGGNSRLAKDGLYHLFVSRWPQSTRRISKGGLANNRPKVAFGFSNTVHAVSKNPFGPYRVIDDLGYGHNTEWYVAKGGKYVVYVISYAYVSDNIMGPWDRYQIQYDSRDRRKPNTPGDYLTNNTFAMREDSSYLMVNRHGQSWFSKTGLTPYYRVSTDCIYPKIEGQFEDPVIWRDNVQYNLIVNDWQGRIAYYMRSKDGVHWKWDAGEAYVPGITVQKNGKKEVWYKYERIKVTQDQYGRPYLANFAVCDTIKYANIANDKHGCKNIFVPLTVGRLLHIENTKPITKHVKEIRVRLSAEKNFDPTQDVDFSSLRFGAPQEVDFGRGCKLIKTHREGKDIILIFNGKGNGITKSNFTAKLIGKTTDGKLLFGYSRLPGVVYIEPILSSRLPSFINREKSTEIRVKVENFGQVDSKKAVLQVVIKKDKKEIDKQTSEITPIKPFGECNCVLYSKASFVKNAIYQVSVTIFHDGLEPEVFTRSVVIKK